MGQPHVGQVRCSQQQAARDHHPGVQPRLPPSVMRVDGPECSEPEQAQGGQQQTPRPVAPMATPADGQGHTRQKGGEDDDGLVNVYPTANTQPEGRQDGQQQRHRRAVDRAEHGRSKAHAVGLLQSGDGSGHVVVGRLAH